MYIILHCSSAVYKVNENSQLLLYQKLPTRGAVSVTTFTTKNTTYLVIANSRDNAGNIEQDVVIYGWHDVTEQFRPIQTILTVDVRRVHAFTAAEPHLVSHSARGMSSLFLACSSKIA